MAKVTRLGVQKDIETQDKLRRQVDKLIKTIADHQNDRVPFGDALETEIRASYAPIRGDPEYLKRAERDPYIASTPVLQYAKGQQILEKSSSGQGFIPQLGYYEKQKRKAMNPYAILNTNHMSSEEYDDLLREEAENRASFGNQWYLTREELLSGVKPPKYAKRKALKDFEKQVKKYADFSRENPAIPKGVSKKEIERLRVGINNPAINSSLGGEPYVAPEIASTIAYPDSGGSSSLSGDGFGQVASSSSLGSGVKRVKQAKKASAKPVVKRAPNAWSEHLKKVRAQYKGSGVPAKEIMQIASQSYKRP